MIYTLKNEESFAIFDEHGNIHPDQKDQLGVYYKGTRYLSQLEMELDGGIKPYLLNSALHRHGTILAVNLTNPKNLPEEEMDIHIHREILLFDNRCINKIVIENFRKNRIQLPVLLRFGADYKDIFDIRGWQRKKVGAKMPVELGGNEVILRYRGADGIPRATVLSFLHKPQETTESFARYAIDLPSHASASFEVGIQFLENREAAGNKSSFSYYLGKARNQNKELRENYCRLETTNEQLNLWIERSLSDLVTLTTNKNGELYPYAGIPWYSTVFGRDGIITALQMLWNNPQLAKGVLLFLARNQASEVDRKNDAEPGKILHEVREGELANLGEIPFAKYYGSVDATPLFLVLAGAYYQRTADIETVEEIWENIERALHWIENYGDCDGDGFVEYAGEKDRGLVHQGWKDSHDSVFYESGEDVRGPVALCEVQAYVFQAYQYTALLAAHMAKKELSHGLSLRARRLQERFEAMFWDEASGFCHLALDREKKPCRVRASNPGHGLYSGIFRGERARSVADTLMSEAFFTGWGIRTLAVGEPRYNPMSYHNGSVWPHDNSLIAYGFSRHGFKRHVLTLFDGLFSATQFNELNRLPELFCGFKRREGEGPTSYPVACSPQAWASASVYILMQALLGLKVDGLTHTVSFHQPILPSCIEEVAIRRLSVGSGYVDLKLTRHERDVGVQVLGKPSSVKVVVEK